MTRDRRMSSVDDAIREKARLLLEREGEVLPDDLRGLVDANTIAAQRDVVRRAMKLLEAEGVAIKTRVPKQHHRWSRPRAIRWIKGGA